MIRAIVFDVGNVLLRWDARLVYLPLLGSEDAMEAFFAEVDFPAWNLAQDAGRSWDDGVAALSAAFPHRAELIEAYRDDWQRSIPGPVPGMVEMLGSLKANGWPILAITNFSEEKWHETRARFPFLDTHLDNAVVSGIEKVLKPERAIYRLCLERNGLRPEEIVFIDDSPRNVAGAETLGIDAILFTDADSLADALAERGIAT